MIPSPRKKQSAFILCLLLGSLVWGRGACAAGAPAPEAEKLVLSGPDAKSVRIVVDENALQTPKQAASELQRLVEKATGQKWPIAGSEDRGGINVFVGPHPLAEQAGLKAGDLPPEGFRILARGNRIFLVGRDTPGDLWNMHWASAPQTGTFYAVVEFARRFLNARWVAPGTMGEVVPRCERLEIPSDFDFHDAPFFRSRKMQIESDNDRDVVRWQRFNRLGWSQVTSFSHAWYQTINPENDSKEHPGWFAMVNGVRQTHMHDKEYGGQLCLANPEVARKMAEIAVENFKKHPEHAMFSISENDGGEHCECPECRALDAEEWQPGKPSLSDRFATFANRTREAVGDRAPGMMLGVYAYHQGELPPVRTVLLPGIAVSDVHNGYDLRFNQPAARARDMKILKGWREKCQVVILTTYFHGMWPWSLPLVATEALADLIQTAARFPSSLGIYAGLSHAHAAFGAIGSEYDLAAELMWNPKQEPARILEDYERAAYGPAAEPLRDYFVLIEKSLARVAAALPVKEDELVGWSWVPSVYDPIQAQADGLIQKAISLTAGADPALVGRVRMVADAWEWTKIQMATLKGLRAFKESASKENAQAMLKVLTRREAFLKAHDKSYDYAISVPEVRGTDQSLAMSVTPSEYEAAITGARKSLDVVLNPGIGKETQLDFIPWSKAAASDPFVKTFDAAAAGVRTTVKVLAGEKCLYVSFDCEESRMDQVACQVKQRDGDVWNDDEVELFLDPNRTRERTFHILVNADGVVLDLVHTGATEDKTWDSHSQISALRRSHGWTIQLAIPYEALGVAAAPRAGDIWGVNFTRSRRVAPSENDAWNPTFGPFYKPGRFGDLIFIKEKPR